MPSGIVETTSSSFDQQPKQGAAPQAGERSRLIQRLLDAGPDLRVFLTDLLTAQAVTVVGTEAAGFVIDRGKEQFELRAIAHIRPDESDAQTRADAIKAFADIIRPCVMQGKDGAIEVGPANKDHEPQYCLVTLLRSGPELVAVSAVVTRCRNMDLARQRLTSMQLVAGYFELYTLRRNAEQSQMVAQSHQRVLQLSTAVATADGFLSAAMNLCNELANGSGATRVSLGWLKGRNIRVRSLSHTEDFDKKQELIVQLERAMEECFDQEQPVLYDPTGDGNSATVTRDAASLSRAQGGHIVLSLPLRRHADIEGVVTLEFLPNHQIGPQVLDALTVAVALLAPQLFDRFQNDRYLVTKMGLSTRYALEETLGPRHWTAKLMVGAVILIVLWSTNFFNLPVLLHAPWLDLRHEYTVEAPFTFAAIDKRTLCAPYDGYLKAVYKKPGDTVTKGQPLFKLDTDELQLKLAQAQSDALSHEREAEKYRADDTKIAEEKVAEAQRDQSQAQADLYQWQINHAVVRAPANGEVLSGDLQDKINAPVKQGDEMMVVANRDDLRANLSVNERDIQDLKQGQKGKLATTSLPTSRFPFTIERIVPLGTPKEGANVFTVYAKLDPKDINNGWRPGMAGDAHVDVAKRTWAWIWTHRLIDFIRLKMWM